MDAREELIEILDFYKYKLKHGGCTMAEIDSATRALKENMEIDGTISDFAKFYGVPENQIRATISRKLLAKPQRKVLYPFHKFAKVVPERWTKKGRDL